MNTISFKITDVVIREKDSTCTVRVKRNDNNYTSILRGVFMSGLLISRIIKARTDSNKMQLEGVTFNSHPLSPSFKSNPFKLVAFINKDTQQLINYKVQLVTEKGFIWNYINDKYGRVSRQRSWQEWKSSQFQRTQIINI